MQDSIARRRLLSAMVAGAVLALSGCVDHLTIEIGPTHHHYDGGGGSTPPDDLENDPRWGEKGANERII